MNNSEKLYQAMLTNSLQRVVEEIHLLEEQRGTLSSMVKGTDEKIERLRVEATRIQEELKSRENATQYGGNVVATLDTAMTALTSKEQELSDKLKRLEALRRTTTTKRGNKKLNRAIYKARKRDLRMKKIVRTTNQIQRVMIMPRQALAKWRTRKVAKVQGKYNYAENKLQEYNQKGALSTLEGLNRAKMIRKRERALEKLRSLQRKGVTNRILGARQMNVNRTQTQNLRNQQQPQNQNTQPMTPPQQVPIQMPPRDDSITAESLARENTTAPTTQVSQTLSKAA